MEYIVYLYMNTFYIMKFIQKGVHTLYTIFFIFEVFKSFHLPQISKWQMVSAQTLEQKKFH